MSQPSHLQEFERVPELHLVRVAEIKVREDRHRREIKTSALMELASSIQNIGLLHPIVIDREKYLIVGERRLRAFRWLAENAIDNEPFFRIPAIYREELDPIDQKLLEYEENAKRVQLHWRDQVVAVGGYHALQSERIPDWNADRTAAALSMSRSSVFKWLRVANALDRGDEQIAASETLEVAIRIIDAREERAAAHERAHMDLALLEEQEIEDDEQLEASETYLTDIFSEAEPKKPTTYGRLIRSSLERYRIYNVDAFDWIKKNFIEGSHPPFDVIHCDFPYGIDFHKDLKGGLYDDSLETHLKLTELLQTPNLLQENAYIIFWFSMENYQIDREYLTKVGELFKWPIIWYKSCGTSISPVPGVTPAHTYEAALLVRVGNARLTGPLRDMHSFPQVRGAIQTSEKPIELLTNIISAMVDDRSRVLDMTCGSGSSICAAYLAGAREAIGLELNKHSAEEGQKRLEALIINIEKSRLQEGEDEEEAI